MTGEGVESIVLMLVIVFAIFHMVRKSSRNIFDSTLSPNEDSTDKQESNESDKASQ